MVFDSYVNCHKTTKYLLAKELKAGNIMTKFFLALERSVDMTVKTSDSARGEDLDFSL